MLRKNQNLGNSSTRPVNIEKSKREAGGKSSMVNRIDDATTLHGGMEMPWLGLGTFELEEGGEVENSVRWALDYGYRSIDTATAYDNEEGVAHGIRQSSVQREDVFLTTKVWNTDQGYDSTLAALKKSLRRLDTDYVDLYLVHWPVEGEDRGDLAGP
jgi:diketogulonate reductase-like aldo/keto reductase